MGGCRADVVRAMALNFGQLAFFSEAKAQLKANTDWLRQHADPERERHRWVFLPPFSPCPSTLSRPACRSSRRGLTGSSYNREEWRIVLPMLRDVKAS